jgi:polysaccharide deacetylase 2 family uncharacterized protein YibQ
LNRGLIRLSQLVAASTSCSHFFIFTVVAVALFCAAGCKTKTTALAPVAIRGITREFVFAARNASGGRAEVGMRPEFTAREPAKTPSLVADHIYVTVPLTKSGVPDRAAHDAIEKEFARVAEFHHLTRVARSGAPGLERFDYFAEGRRTQSVHLITPLGKSGVLSSSSSSGASSGSRSGLTSGFTSGFTSSSRHPRLAIVIDDLGNDRAQADELFRLSYPLTLSVLPLHSGSAEIAEEAHRRGYQVMLHLPMASNAGDKDEPIELHPGMDTASVDKTFSSMLETVPYAAGVNNHEGSLGTSDQKLMDELMPLLHEHQLFFIDSRTTAATVAETAAHAARVPAASRNVFLDDDESADAIRKQFALAIRDAREKGSALAIGHPHPETLQVLAEMLPGAEKQGVTLVFASDLAK